MTAFRAGFRYELLMQLRKRSAWLTMAALAALTVVVSPGNVTSVFSEPDPAAAMVFAGRLVLLLLPVGFGALLADRLVRDEVLNVRQVLDATPGHQAARLLGKYLGACLACAVPVLGCYLAMAVGYGDFAALRYALVVAVAVLVPALLFVGAFAMLCSLVMPAPLFRVLFAGYWFWACLVDPGLLPTLNQTLVGPVNAYALEVFLGADLAGPVPGAAFNLLRPDPTTATALLSVAVLLAMAAGALAAARALLARTAR